MVTKKSRPLRIGISSCFFHADPNRAVFKGKTLLYLEQSLAHWILGRGVLAYMIPTLPFAGAAAQAREIQDYVDDLDGLLLQGGADVSPESYGEKPLKPEWSGDIIRDIYETSLVNKFIEAKKPVFGVCRGLQLLNVALGGSLYQDIGTQIENSLVHRSWEVYDQNFHDVELEPGSLIDKVCGASALRKVNSVHHQAIKVLAPHLKVEARSKIDGLVEAVKGDGDSFVYGVQWHPEFHPEAGVFDESAILNEFLMECQKRRDR